MLIKTTLEFFDEVVLGYLLLINLSCLLALFLYLKVPTTIEYEFFIFGDVFLLIRPKPDIESYI